MSLKRFTVRIASLLLVFGVSLRHAQEQAPGKKPIPSSSTSKSDDQDPIKIFTEEVILPIVAYDAYGRFDPTVRPDDVLVLEDGIPQHVKSARRLPLNVVLLIDMGSVLVFTQHLEVTRRIAMRVVSKLRSGDRIALIQFTNRAEVLQDWTDDNAAIVKALHPERGKLLSGNRSRLSEGIIATADRLTGKEAGSTHVVLITDGDDAPGSEYAAAVRRLLRHQPALHVLSYTTLAGQEARKRKGGFFFDRQMKRFYAEYDRAIKDSERRLRALTEILGGSIFLPTSEEEAVKQAEELADEIAASFVLTYSPKRAIESGDNIEPRYIQVFPRRTGLRVRALRKTVAAAPTESMSPPR